MLIQNRNIFSPIAVRRIRPRMYGGRSDNSFLATPTHKVHPRVYGADDNLQGESALKSGPSPCTRGRIRQYLLQNHPGMAHPRVHGTDARTIRKKSCCMGSSPCIRGRRQRTDATSTGTRFIPVYTGQTGPTISVIIRIGIHPRVYGADTKFLKRIPVVSKPFFLS